MDSYLGKYSGIRQGKRHNKVMIAAISIVVILLLIVMAIGIIAGADSERSREISSAIAENTELKQLVAEQQEQIESLTAQLEELAAKLPPEEMVPHEGNDAQSEASQYPASPREELE